MDQCRTFVSLYDTDKDGIIDLEQLKLMCDSLNECYKSFIANSKEEKDYMILDELKTSLDQMGINVAPSTINIALNRYYNIVNVDNKDKGKSQTAIQSNNLPKNQAGSKDVKGIDFTNFAVCVLKMKNVMIYWDNRIENENSNNENSQQRNVSGSKQTLQFVFKDFLEQMIYS